MNESEIEQPVASEAPESETAEPPVDASGQEPLLSDMAPEQLGLLDKPEASESEEARLRALVEAVVYITDEPLSATQVAQALGEPKDRVEKLLEELQAEYSLPHHGLTVREVAGGFKMSTKPEFHEEIRGFVKKLKPPLKLSMAALETLAVVAYKQPITAPEIMEIRGVQGAGVLKTLLERKLITAAGRKQVVGKPVLYRTTKDFLVQFGLKDLSELPTLKEFEEWSRLALGDAEVQAASPSEPQVPVEAAPDVVQATQENRTESVTSEEKSEPEPEP
jgi:segregation and condensation protein B